MAALDCACLGSPHDMLLPSLVDDAKADDHPAPISSFNGVSITPAEIHVLAVDDSVIDRKVIENLLKVSAFKVTAVDSGSKALDFLGLGGSPRVANINISMIITDYCMPGMSGYELLKCVKESSTFKEIPVVVMSSENVPTRIESCLAEGAEEFIMKPVQLADVTRLKAHIRQLKLDPLEAPSASCSKRKFASEDQSPARRTRLSGVMAA